MLVFATSMLLNTFLNYCFIFGNFGAPALGVTGAAIATLTSRIVEFLIVVVYALRSRRVPLMPRALFCPGRATVRIYVKYATPVLINETFWGLGTTMMTVIMGHMAISADTLAAYAIMGNIDKFSTVSCFGLAGATAVIIGKRIGEGASKDEVYDLSWCLLLVALGLGILIGGVLAVTLPTLFIPYLYPLFSLSPTATEAAATMCIVYLLTMPLKSFDISNITGVLRAGGDATMASIIDLVPLWCAAVPLAALAALVLDAPMIFVCLGLYAENFFKCPWGIIRLRSRKWINDVTRGLTYELFLLPRVRRAAGASRRRLRCGKGHSFDTAREGYTHLLPPNRKHSAAPGDDKGMGGQPAGPFCSGATMRLCATLCASWLCAIPAPPPPCWTQAAARGTTPAAYTGPSGPRASSPGRRHRYLQIHPALCRKSGEGH